MQIRIKTLVPKEYQQVEYIESTGTQYFNTGVAVSTSIGYSLSFQASSTTYNSKVDNIMLGARNKNQRFWVDFDNSSANHNILFGYGGYFHVLDQVSGNYGVFVFETNTDGDGRGQCQLYQDGVLLATYNASTQNISANTLNMYMFAANDGGTAKFFSQVKIHRCKMYSDGTLIRDFVPCYKKSDGEVGMYDVANNVFYTNQGTDNFVKGDDVGHHSLCMPRLTLLPNIYQQVEYIASSGTEYINTGFVPNMNTKIDAKFRFLSGNDSSVPLIGARMGTTNRQRFLPLAMSGTTGMRMTLGDSQKEFSGINYNADYRIIFDVKNNTYSINGSTVSELNKNQWTIVNNNNLYIFATTGYEPTLYQSKGRVYYCKIWDNGDLVRDLIPCYRKSDGEIGLFDSVNRVFYTNQGTGTFAKGNNVGDSNKPIPFKIKSAIIPGAYQQVEYIESTGTQYIDTGIVPTIANETLIKGAFALNDTSIGNAQSLGTNMNINFYAASNLKVFRPCGYQTTIPLDTDKHVYTIQVKSTGRYATLDSNSFIGAIPANIGNFNIYLGAMSGDGTVYYGNYKIYPAQIYNSGNLVRNLVPCYRKSDGVIGMYDTVSQAFFENQGTGVFLKGNDIK